MQKTLFISARLKPGRLQPATYRSHRRPHLQRLRQALVLAVCVAGIYGAYLTQGVVQEALSTKRFGAAGARFTHLSALNALQSWVCFAWAGLLMLVWERR